MLERTAGCLESGSLRRLLPASRKTLKSRRSLHSAFWTHGATDIELSPLWAALLRTADPDSSSQQPDTLQTTLNGSGGVLLDFLYPVGTLTFLQQYSGWSSDRQDGRWGRVGVNKFAHRLYTSSAKSSSVQNENMEGSLIKSAPEGDGNTDQLLKLFNDDKVYDFNEAWRLYRLLDKAAQKQLRLRLLKYLTHSRAIIDAERIVELFEGLSVKERNSEAFISAIRSYLRLQNVSDALGLHEVALVKFEVLTGSDELLAYLVEKSLWSHAFKTWESIQDFRRRHPGPDNVLGLVKQIPKLGSLALDLADYVNNRVRASAIQSDTAKGDTTPEFTTAAVAPPDVALLDDTQNDTISELEFFASIMIRHAMFHDEYDQNQFERFLSVLHAWGHDDPDLYDNSIRFLLDWNQPMAAVQLYRKSRRTIDVHFSRHVLMEILKLSCAHRSVLGMQEVLDDFFRFHGAPTTQAYKMCMREFAAMGDADTVHALFDQYLLRIRDKKIQMLPGDMSPILSVHAKRGELEEVIKHFNELREKYQIEPDILCWNILIHAHGKVNDIDGAYAAWETVLNSQNLTPTAYTFGTVMGICVWNGDLERTIDVYQIADRMDIKKTTAMVDCLVLAHLQDDHLKEAEEICENALTMDLEGSLTRMWNYLLVAHAMRRELVEVNRILQRMSDANIDYTGMTYAALMQALAMVKQPDRAYKILKEVMVDAGLLVTPFHYAIVMGGYIANGEFHKVFQVQKHMNRRKLRPTASNNVLVMKATFKEDEKLLQGGTLQEQRYRAMQIFQVLVGSIDRQDVASGPLKGTKHITADIAYPTMIYSYVLFVLAQHDEHATVQELYQQYIGLLPEKQRNKQPLAILTALMISKNRDRDFKSVQECWDLAVSHAKRCGSSMPQIPPTILPISENSKSSSGTRKIVPLHQLDLHRIFATYANSLARQQRVDEVIKVVDRMLDDGFLLSNKNWNQYISILSKAFRVKLAFTLCETKLMPGWTGWARVRWQAPERNRLSFKLRALKKEPRHLRPVFHTLLFLSKNFLEVREMATESKGYQMLLSELQHECPNTMRAINTMQREDGDLERSVLGA